MLPGVPDPGPNRLCFPAVPSFPAQKRRNWVCLEHSPHVNGPPDWLCSAVWVLRATDHEPRVTGPAGRAKLALFGISVIWISSLFRFSIFGFRASRGPRPRANWVRSPITPRPGLPSQLIPNKSLTTISMSERLGSFSRKALCKA